MKEKVIGAVMAFALCFTLLYGCSKVYNAIQPIQCKKCVHCGHTVRWQGGLPGQMGGPCRKCGGFMGDCDE